MINFDKVFEEYQHSDKTEKSLSEFSNWILGISTGICALFIFEIRDFDFSMCIYIKPFYRGIAIFAIANTFLTGYSKYFILKRNVAMSIKYDTLKKLEIFSKINKSKPEEIKDEWTQTFNELAIQHNKITCMAKLLKISIFTTLITIAAIGIFILLII